MHFSLSGIYLLSLGIMILIFNKKGAIAAAEFAEIISSKTPNKLVLIYRIWACIVGTVFTFVGLALILSLI